MSKLKKLSGNYGSQLLGTVAIIWALVGLAMNWAESDAALKVILLGLGLITGGEKARRLEAKINK